MQPKGRIVYILDETDTFIPWEGLTTGFGGVTLFSPSGTAIDTPNGTGADNYTPVETLTVTGLTYAFDGSTWDRIRAFAGNADAITAPTVGLMGSADFGLSFNGTTWDRNRSTGNNSDAVAVKTAGVLETDAYMMAFNGTNWQRVRTGIPSADGVGNSAGIATFSQTYIFNGNASTSYDRMRSISAANVSLAAQIGVAAVGMCGNWSINHTPAANTQATISRAAVASQRHVCTSITARLTAAIATTSGAVTLNLRDGATGAGTILWSQSLQVGGAASITVETDKIEISGLSIFGSVNTAMTLEFSAAGGASTVESVALTGYTVA